MDMIEGINNITVSVNSYLHIATGAIHIFTLCLKCRIIYSRLLHRHIDYNLAKKNVSKAVVTCEIKTLHDYEML